MWGRCVEGVCILDELQFSGGSVQKARPLFSAPEERKKAKKNIFTFVLRKLYFPLPNCPHHTHFWYHGHTVLAHLPSSGSPCVELALILQGMMDFSSETVWALHLSCWLSCTLASFPYWMRIVGALLCGDWAAVTSAFTSGSISSQGSLVTVPVLLFSVCTACADNPSFIFCNRSCDSRPCVAAHTEPALRFPCVHWVPAAGQTCLFLASFIPCRMSPHCTVYWQCWRRSVVFIAFLTAALWIIFSS